MNYIFPELPKITAIYTSLAVHTPPSEIIFDEACRHSGVTCPPHESILYERAVLLRITPQITSVRNRILSKLSSMPCPTQKTINRFLIKKISRNPYGLMNNITKTIKPRSFRRRSGNPLSNNEVRRQTLAELIQRTREGVGLDRDRSNLAHSTTLLWTAYLRATKQVKDKHRRRELIPSGILNTRVNLLLNKLTRPLRKRLSLSKSGTRRTKHGRSGKIKRTPKWFTNQRNPITDPMIHNKLIKWASKLRFRIPKKKLKYIKKKMTTSFYSTRRNLCRPSINDAESNFIVIGTWNVDKNANTIRNSLTTGEFIYPHSILLDLDILVISEASSFCVEAPPPTTTVWMEKFTNM